MNLQFYFCVFIGGKKALKIMDLVYEVDGEHAPMQQTEYWFGRFKTGILTSKTRNALDSRKN